MAKFELNNNEIVSENIYKMFRADRSQADLIKYDKVGGGGVIILIRQDLEIESSLINIKCKAPVLSVALKFNDKSKYY